MISINPQSVALYMRCPVLYSKKTIEKTDIRTEILDRVIRKVYFNQLRTEQRVVWKKVRWCLDREVNLLAKSPEDISAGISLLPNLSKWYEEFYLPGPEVVMPSVPIVLNLSAGAQYTDIIPFLNLDKKIRMFDIAWCEQPSVTDLYRDTVTHIRAWGLYRAFREVPHYWERIFFYGTTMKKIAYPLGVRHTGVLDRTVKHIVEGMVRNIIYPSVRPECNQCQQISNCSW